MLHLTEACYVTCSCWSAIYLIVPNRSAGTLCFQPQQAMRRHSIEADIKSMISPLT